VNLGAEIYPSTPSRSAARYLPGYRPPASTAATTAAALRSRLAPGRVFAAAREPRRSRVPDQDLRMLTARAITSAPTDNDTADWTSIVSFAHLASGITSVGLNAVALVKDR